MKTLLTIALFATTLFGCAGNTAGTSDSLSYERIEVEGAVLEVLAEYSEDLNVMEYELTYFDGLEEVVVYTEIELYDAEVGDVVPSVEVRRFFDRMPTELRDRLHAAAERLETPPAVPGDLEPVEGAASSLALVHLDELVDLSETLPELPPVGVGEGCIDSTYECITE
jgi:hypothetical protein